MAAHVPRRVGLLAIAAICSMIVAACGATGGPRMAGGAPAASAAATSTAMTTASAATSLHLVGLGDSIAGAGHCGGCRSYVLSLGDLASASLGKPVVATNLARNDNLTSSRLAGYVKRDDDIRRQLAEADIVTIGIGWNDWQGPCSWTGHAACLASGQDAVEKNLTQTLKELGTLRTGRPTAIRVVTYADQYRGDPEAAGAWGFPATPADTATFEAAFGAALTSFDDMLCRVATANGATCVDLVPAFNGPSGTEPFAPDLRGSQAQMDLIARTIDATGYAPLQ